MLGHSVKLFNTTAERKDDLAIGRLNVMVRAEMSSTFWELFEFVQRCFLP